MIRQATKEDLEAVSLLWKDMVLESRPEWEPDVNKWVKTGEALFDSGVYFLVVYEKDNTILGFIDGMMYQEPSTGKMTGVAQHFYVKPEARGTGISGDLYKEIMYIAVRNESENLELFCFPEMEEFWEDRGFKKERILMRRSIDV